MKYFFKYLVIGIFLFYPLVSYAACPPDKPIQTLSGCMPCDDPDALLQFKCITCDDEPNVDVLAVCPNRQRKGIVTILKECPLDKPHRTSEGDCYACSDEREFFVEKDYKNPCENRMIYHRGESYVSGIICPSDKPIYSFGKCYACSEEKELYILDNNKNPCSNRTIHKKGESYISVLNCPDDKPLYSKGKCYACDTTKTLTVSSDIPSDICPNRRVEFGESKFECPIDKPLRDSQDNCYSCLEPNDIMSPKKDSCPNRKIETRVVDGLNREKYSVLVCPTLDKPLKDDLGQCHACDEESVIKVSIHECRKACSNRVTDKAEYCLSSCPSDKPQVDRDGFCHSCDDVFFIIMEEGQEHVCSNRQVEKKEKNKYYSAQICPPDQPIYDKNIRCHTCMPDLLDHGFIPLNPTDCTKLCPNNHLVNGICSPCPEGQFWVDHMERNLHDPLSREEIKACVSCEDERYVYDGTLGMVKRLCPNRMDISTWGGIYSANKSIVNKIKSRFSIFY